MTFIIHYMVRTALTPLHFDTTTHDPVTEKNLDSFRLALANLATDKINRVVSADDIVIANIIPIPDGEPDRPFADPTRRHVPPPSPPERQPTSQIGGS